MDKKRGKRELHTVIFSIMIVFLLITGVSAGLFDWFKGTITGKASSQPTNVSITIAGINSVTITVWNQSLNGTVVDPTEENSSALIFVVTVRDADGTSDLNDSSVVASFYKGSDIRSNTSACSKIAGNSTTLTQNYSCTVRMWYWDAAGAWTINISANDLGNQTYIYNTSTVFSYDQLQAIKLTPPVIYWTSVTIGATNKTAANATTVNNTGNYNATGKISINATNLYSGSNFLDVGNITSDVDTGGASCSGDACTECDGTVLSNAINTAISGVILETGNLSLSRSNETLYYCLKSIPSTIPSGVYDTSTGGSWSIKLT
jgi:hypothetical protein